MKKIVIIKLIIVRCFGVSGNGVLHLHNKTGKSKSCKAILRS